MVKLIKNIFAVFIYIKEVLSVNIVDFINLFNNFVSNNFVSNNQQSYNIVLFFLFNLSISFIIYGLIKKYIEIKNILNEFSQILFITIAGVIASLFEFDFIKNNFNKPNLICIFILVTLLLIILFLIESIIYSKSIKDIFIQNIKIYSIWIKLTIFICLAISKLTIFELVVAQMLIIVINIVITKLSLESTNIKKRQNFYSCVPINSSDQLFSSRRKQLKFVKKELINKFDNINSVVISGNWGTGKSSFVNALKNELLKDNNVDIINIQCGIECDLKQILNSISLQIENIMKKNNIYTRNNGIIHKYFKSIYNLVENTDYEIFAHIGNLFKNNTQNFFELRDEMNNKLRKLKDMKIYIFIDDLDRILDEESRINILKIIYESINLDRCLTIFSLDMDQFLCEREYGYIEKYVDFNINLTNISFYEIVDMYTNDFFVNTLSFHMVKDNK